VTHHRIACSLLVLIASATLAIAADSAVAQTTNPGPFPFATGMLASVSGSTLEVQGRNGESKVVVTGSTAYQQTKPAAPTDIATGDCVQAIGTGSTTSGIQATTLVISKPSSSGCAERRPTGFRRGQGRGGFGRSRAQANPTANGQTPPVSTPDGGDGSRPANFARAFGVVKSVSGDQVTVKAQIPTPPSSKNKKPTTKTQNVDATITPDTTVSQTVPATAKDLAVGSCVMASGKVDSVGTVTANRVEISQPANGACSFGFGGRGPGGFGQPGGQQSA